MRAREREMKTGDICIFPPLEILLWLSLTLLLLQHSSSQMLNCCRDIYWIVVRAGNIKTFKCWFSENSTTVPSQIIKLKALSQNIKTETACRFLNSDSLTRFLLPLFSFISHFTVGFVEQYRTFRNEISLFLSCYSHSLKLWASFFLKYSFFYYSHDFLMNISISFLSLSNKKRRFFKGTKFHLLFNYLNGHKKYFLTCHFSCCRYVHLSFIYFYSHH